MDDPPLHAMVVCVSEATSCDGAVTVTLTEEVHPLASVTVYDCVPAACVNVPVPVYGDVPPVALTVTVVVPPTTVIGGAVAVAINATGCAMVRVVVAVQLLASITVTVKLPAPTVNVLLVWNGGPLFRLYLNVPVPPEAVTVNVVVPPLHNIVAAVADTLIAVGSVTVILTDDVHPLASVTVYD